MEANQNDSLFSKAESPTNSTFTSSVTLAADDNGQHIMLFYTVYPYMAAILGISLNAGSILVIVFGKIRGKGIKLQLVILALIDMVGAVLIPSYLISAFQPHAYYRFLSSSLCKFLLWTIYSPFYVSLLCNIVISLEQFVAIYFPLKMQNYTTKWKVVVISLCWVISLAMEVNLITNTGNALAEDSEGRKRCRFTHTWIHKLNGPVVMVVTLKYLIPAFAIIVCYIAVVLRLVCWNKPGASIEENGGTAKKGLKRMTSHSRQKQRVN